jgi:long-chain acyl-CoA synthetase
VVAATFWADRCVSLEIWQELCMGVAAEQSPALGVSNVADLVRAAATREPRRTAVVSGSTRVSWAELDAQVDAVAAGLRRLDLRPGERVAVVLGNTLPFVQTWFGVLRAGLVAVLLNVGSTDDEVAFHLQDCGARVAVVEPSRRLTLAPALARIDHVVCPGDDAWTALFAQSDAPVEIADPPADRSALAALVYTSGTSGRPRGAMLTHGALLANLEQMTQTAVPVVVPGDVMLLVLPLFHIYGLNAGLGNVAAHAATAVLVPRFDPVDTLALVRDEHITSILGAPPMYVAWSMLPAAREALAGVRIAVSGAAPLSAELFTRMRDTAGVTVHEGYGLTEAAPVVSATLVTNDPVPGSVGHPLPGVEVRLRDEQGATPTTGEPGEVSIRGANLFSGYWPSGEGGPDGEGWFRTGDIATYDERGNLFLVGRRIDLILVSGLNVYPREVEAVLIEHPAVAAVEVVGVPHPYSGQAVKALVVPEPGTAPTASEIIAFAGRRLARFKCPTAVEFVAALPGPRTGSAAKAGPAQQSGAAAGMTPA